LIAFKLNEGKTIKKNVKFKAYITFKASSDDAFLGRALGMIHRMI